MIKHTLKWDFLNKYKENALKLHIDQIIFCVDNRRRDFSK